MGGARGPPVGWDRVVAAGIMQRLAHGISARKRKAPQDRIERLFNQRQVVKPVGPALSFGAIVGGKPGILQPTRSH